MGRKKKEVDGQLSFEMCLCPENYVVQSNNLIRGKQSLTLNEAKLIRAAIMQIVKEDTEFKAYSLSAKEFADLLSVNPSNIYRDAEKICRGITNKPVELKAVDAETGHTKWRTIPWVSVCEYDTGKATISIKLNDELRPYLLELKGYYTQYPYLYALGMRSIHALRILELLEEKRIVRTLPREGIIIDLYCDEIREACDLYTYDNRRNVIGMKYENFGMFKKKVVDVAVAEIERDTMYTLSYEYIKKGRQVIGFHFKMNVKYH